ncbi:EAL domain-containing protein [Brevibacterium jeotgali]|uniref:EAL domain, c-di-GMP-specific phosphodiesterase class I (Or its enzymatically inactive variant) n=1 Tax=Brevibacterium jeotgali TaxID=1262550 RepID=A0A2H1L6U6_9MICO|nr:EAL domain-containing protein [Brevibacterium jeotgali]TWC02708.1 EAL domain-containing protein (putative c-di-GMP-specific phosphodiesterase class I) [Brevibacterium jeotgali]SMY12618.1 EAL domain, c-di-GMP-specific phosphodiesterase class I (or its enzymatically inactive variant) [Brevibacterium jeotgali]
MGTTDASMRIDSDLDLEELVRSGLVTTYFGPVVDLETDTVVAHQVFHGSVGSACFGIDDFVALRRAVRESPLAGDLDSSLRSLALREAETLELPRSNRLLLTTEPQSLVTVEDRTSEPDRSAILQLHPERVAMAPAMSLRSVRQARSLGWGIGMSSIGADLSTTSFLPLVNPSVVTLHRNVLDIEDTTHIADLVRLLHAHVERTEAIIIADGIRDEADVVMARAMGARFGTGQHFGAPSHSPTPVDPAGEDPLEAHYTRNLPAQGTPFTIAQGLGRDPMVMGAEMLEAQLASLEERTLTAGKSAVVIGIFADHETLSADTIERYTRIADSAGYTVMLSNGFDSPPVPAAWSGPLDTSDPLQQELAVVMVGPDWSGMTVGKRRPAPGTDGRTEYDVFVTTDRYACVDAARSVMSRIRALR